MQFQKLYAFPLIVLLGVAGWAICDDRRPHASSGPADKQGDKAIYKDYVLLEREKQEEAARDQARAERRGKVASAEDESPRRFLSMDFSTVKRPRSLDAFQPLWHLPPKRQWWTGNCWCFSATSLMESEAHRLHGLSIKLSEPFTVYWEFVEKAREFVRTKGESLFDEGSESSALLRSWKKNGIVRESDYTGLVGKATVFDQSIMMDDLHAYLEFVKTSSLWDEAFVVNGVRLILDRHMGRPPEKITVDGNEMSPQDFLRNVLRIEPDDYVEFMSFLYSPFWESGEYKAADNYWHGREYLNVPLDEWYRALKGAVAGGYSVCLGGDVSEPGYNGHEDIAVIPSFDIPPESINQDAREYRFDAEATTDDHGVHLVGLKEMDGHDWYLVKDSSRSGQRGVPGYYFYRDDYIRLKMLTFMVHKDAAKDLLERLARHAASNK